MRGDNVDFTGNIIGGNPSNLFLLNGIELSDPSATDPICQKATPTPPGSDVFIITYTLAIVDAQAVPAALLSNTASILNYSNEDNLDPTLFSHTIDNTISDSSTTTIPPPAITNVITDTDQSTSVTPLAGNVPVVIGELVTFRTVVTLPEGTIPNAILTLTPGVTGTSPETSLSFLDTSDTPDSLVTTRTTPFSNMNNLVATTANSFTYNMQTLTNIERVNSNTETMTIEWTACVNNAPAVVNGNTYSPQGQFDWSLGTITATSRILRIVEPRLRISISYSPTLVDAGDIVTFTVRVSHVPVTSTANAYDISLSGGNADFEIDPLSFAFTSGAGTVISPPGGIYSV